MRNFKDRNPRNLESREYTHSLSLFSEWALHVSDTYKFTIIKVAVNYLVKHFQLQTVCSIGWICAALPFWSCLDRWSSCGRDRGAQQQQQLSGERGARRNTLLERPESFLSLSACQSHRRHIAVYLNVASQRMAPKKKSIKTHLNTQGNAAKRESVTFLA